MLNFKNKAQYKDLIDTFVEAEKEKCLNPNCKSNNIDGNYDIEVDDPKIDDLAPNEVYIDKQCRVCGIRWREYYKLYDAELRDRFGHLIDINDLPEPTGK